MRHYRYLQFLAQPDQRSSMIKMIMGHKNKPGLTTLQKGQDRFRFPWGIDDRALSGFPAEQYIGVGPIRRNREFFDLQLRITVFWSHAGAGLFFHHQDSGIGFNTGPEMSDPDIFVRLVLIVVMIGDRDSDYGNFQKVTEKIYRE